MARFPPLSWPSPRSSHWGAAHQDGARAPAGLAATGSCSPPEKSPTCWESARCEHGAAVSGGHRLGYQLNSGLRARMHKFYGGRGRTRTGTPVSQKQILSLLCLPFHHAARAHAF